jgi:glucose/mannose transport system permease protein
MKIRNPGLTILVALTLVFLTVAYVLPMYVVVVTSLKTAAEISQRRYLLPSTNLQFENFATAFELILPSLLNSTIIAFSVTFLSALFGGLGGYYLARTRTTFSKILFVLVGIAIYLPYQVILIPLVQLMARTGLALTHFGLILSYLILNVPLASVLMGTFFTAIPRELEEAAEVDGASRVQIFFRVITPVALPAYASTAIIVFTAVWNEFLLALTLATPHTTTIQIKLAEIKGSFVANYQLQMAAALITLIVPLVFFLVLGRYFIRGILAGALKG